MKQIAAVPYFFHKENNSVVFAGHFVPVSFPPSSQKKFTPNHDVPFYSIIFDKKQSVNSFHFIQKSFVFAVRLSFSSIKKPQAFALLRLSIFMLLHILLLLILKPLWEHSS